MIFTDLYLFIYFFGKANKKNPLLKGMLRMRFLKFCVRGRFDIAKNLPTSLYDNRGKKQFNPTPLRGVSSSRFTFQEKK